jgi:predicted O-methyltransferase YrrM
MIFPNNWIEEDRHEIASAILEQRFLGHIRCEKGWTSKILPGLVPSMKGIDFLFHDAGHSRKDYLQDFHAVEPVLRPGSVVVIDDIRWHDRRFSASAPECYRGWRELLQHHRILWAVELALAKNEHMGLFLLR